MMGKRRQRFPGAGGSVGRRFSLLRRQKVLEEWRVWLLVTLSAIAMIASSFFVGGLAARTLAASGGALLGVMILAWALGGHVSVVRWSIGAQGERQTAHEIEKLGPEWHCEHDLEHEHGNWDHVLVGPAGVFVLDSKLWHSTAEARDDALRSGRLVYRGGSARFGAMRIKQALEQRLGSHAPWVQAVVVVWADFPQARHEEVHVVYLRGDQLRPWLAEQRERANAPQRAALVTALREVRASLMARD
jgi:hypothetical protein